MKMIRLRNCLLGLAALFIIGCNKLEVVTTPDSADFKGTVSVWYEEAWFNNEDIGVLYSPSEDGTTATITIFKIRFVPKMPVRIDVAIPDVRLTTSDGVTHLECDNVIPLALGGEYPKYTVTNLTGTQKGDELEFSLNFGIYPTTFKGMKQ